jgi:hypothetical protein
VGKEEDVPGSEDEETANREEERKRLRKPCDCVPSSREGTDGKRKKRKTRERAS